jgi:hypothetical protein
MAHLAVGNQPLQQFERRRIDPLKVVEKEHERVLRPCKDIDESLEDQMKAVLAVLRGKVRNWWLLASNEGEFRNEIDDELTA